MTLITRLGRLLRADLNAVLDGLEEPLSLLRQAMRDMQATLDDEQREARRLRAEAQRLALAIEESDKRLATLDEELSLCLAMDQEALARELVRRKLETVAHAMQLGERLHAMLDAEQRLALRITEHGQRLDALRAEASRHEGMEPAPGESGAWPKAASVTAADIEVALLRERQRRAQS